MSAEPQRHDENTGEDPGKAARFQPQLRCAELRDGAGEEPAVAVEREIVRAMPHCGKVATKFARNRKAFRCNTERQPEYFLVEVSTSTIFKVFRLDKGKG